MSYRDELSAALARCDELEREKDAVAQLAEQEVQRARSEVALVRAGVAPPLPTTPWFAWGLFVGLAVMTVRAAYGSEREGVQCALLAAPALGLSLGLTFARRTRRHHQASLWGFLGAAIALAMAAAFFSSLWGALGLMGISRPVISL